MGFRSKARTSGFDLTDHLNKLSVTYMSLHGWEIPETQTFWFHGRLIVLCGALGTGLSITAAVLQTKAFLNDHDRMQGKPQLILIPLRYPILQILPEVVKSSSVLPLIVNTSAETCSPGFCALTHVLTFFCWKESLAHGEQCGATEIFNMTFKKLSLRDILFLCQSSLGAEKWYCFSVPQFGNLKVRRSKSPVPSCGSMDNLDGPFAAPRTTRGSTENALDWLPARLISDAFVPIAMGARIAPVLSLAALLILLDESPRPWDIILIVTLIVIPSAMLGVMLILTIVPKSLSNVCIRPHVLHLYKVEPYRRTRLALQYILRMCFLV